MLLESAFHWLFVSNFHSNWLLFYDLCKKQKWLFFFLKTVYIRFVARTVLSKQVDWTRQGVGFVHEGSASRYRYTKTSRRSWSSSLTLVGPQVGTRSRSFTWTKVAERQYDLQPLTVQSLSDRRTDSFPLSPDRYRRCPSSGLTTITITVDFFEV